MFTCKWLYRPGKSNVADPLSRSPGVVAAITMLLVLIVCAGVVLCIVKVPAADLVLDASVWRTQGQ